MIWGMVSCYFDRYFDHYDISLLPNYDYTVCLKVFNKELLSRFLVDHLTVEQQATLIGGPFQRTGKTLQFQCTLPEVPSIYLRNMVTSTARSLSFLTLKGLSTDAWLFRPSWRRSALLWIDGLQKETMNLKKCGLLRYLRRLNIFACLTFWKIEIGVLSFKKWNGEWSFKWEALSAASRGVYIACSFACYRF